MRKMNKYNFYAVLLIMGMALSLIHISATPVLAKKQITSENARNLPYTPVVTPNGSSLPWKIVNGVKEYHLSDDVDDDNALPNLPEHLQ